jgi:hypothetical protein
MWNKVKPAEKQQVSVLSFQGSNRVAMVEGV